MAAWRRSQPRSADATAERARLRGKLARLQELYVEGEIDKARYAAERDVIVAGLAGLPTEPGTDDDAGRLLLDFMADMSKAWTLARSQRWAWSSGGTWAGRRTTRERTMDKYARRQYFGRLYALRETYRELGPDDTRVVISVEATSARSSTAMPVRAACTARAVASSAAFAPSSSYRLAESLPTTGSIER